MPAIVLMNLHHATSLLKLLDKDNKNPMACFWKERSFLYVMSNIYAYIRHDYCNMNILNDIALLVLFLEENEYFYKPQLQQQPEEEISYTVDELPLFQEARRQWHDAQQAKQVDTIREVDSTATQSDTRSELSEEYAFDH